MQIMTFNIRIDLPIDKEYAFKHRIDGIKMFLSETNPEMIGFQETSLAMLQVLERTLTNYHYVGEARDINGEYNPIFIKRSYPIHHTQTHWYSNEPRKKQKGAMFPRIFTTLETTVNHTTIEIINTHFSHVSDAAKTESLETLKTYISSKQHPIILLGDFNANPHVVNPFLDDIMHSCWETYREKHKLTAHGFNDKVSGDPIDYIWTTKDLEISHTKIHRDKYNNTYISDHYPVSATVKTKKTIQ